MCSKLIFYAPNVHAGGGLVLLKNLITSWPGGALTLVLDSRARSELEILLKEKVYWVKPSFKSRIMAEFFLWRNSSISARVLCFHGLPPLLSSGANVILFLQNRNYICKNNATQFNLWTSLRINIELIIFRLFKNRVSHYIVQTPSMRDALKEWISRASDPLSMPKISVTPFFGEKFNPSLPKIFSWDFIYVADGEAHKNHRNLIKAWELLAKEGIRPSLCLTLNERNSALKFYIDHAIMKNELQIYDLGSLSREDVIIHYRKSRALIFPSYSESFGLPLIEASLLDLPILAPEMDYVRDVCIPVETFDPNSPMSIARSVKRFLGYSASPISLKEPNFFWDTVLENFKND